MPVFPDGSLGTLGEGSMAFASNSGSTLADFTTVLAGMGLAIIASAADAIAGNLTASVGP